MMHLIGVTESAATSWFTCEACGATFAWKPGSYRRRKVAMDLVAEHISKEH